MDHRIFQQLKDERLDWRFRAVPASAFGSSAQEWLDTQPRAADLPTPTLTLSESALSQNLLQMAQWARNENLTLLPHGKATMAPQLWARQLSQGAEGITVANVAQGRIAIESGVRRLFIANLVLDPRDVAQIGEWIHSGIEVCHLVDSPAAVAALSAASVPLPVCVELGVSGGRSGVRSVAEALDLAATVHDHPQSRLVGVGGYEGVITAGSSDEDLSRVDHFLGDLAKLARQLEFSTQRPIVSAGGSAYIDRVAHVLGPMARDGYEVLIRSGAYVTHDHGFYARLAPCERIASGPQLRPALRVRSRVLTRPEPGLAIIDAGRRDVPFDQGLPVPLNQPGVTVSQLSDQHGFLAGDTEKLQVGEVIELGISHPCTAFDKWNLIPLVDDSGAVTDLIRTFF